VAPDVILAPVVGWDAAGFRLGHGGGSFDRTLAVLSPRPLPIGVGLESARLATIFPRPQEIALAYSALSLAVLAWLIGAAGRASFVPLWDGALWQVYVPVLTVYLVLAMAITRRNAFSFGSARNGRFDPVPRGSSGWIDVRCCWRGPCGLRPTPFRMAIWHM
jgi:5-formyltetrahydrofolate cyclo-ligase family/NnrU protein